MTLFVISNIDLSEAKIVVRLRRLMHLDPFPRQSVIQLLIMLPAGPVLIVLIEGWGRDLLVLQTHRFALVQDPLQTVDQILMVFVTVEYVKTAQDKFIFFLNKFVEELDVLLLREMVASEAVHEL